MKRVSLSLTLMLFPLLSVFAIAQELGWQLPDDSRQVFKSTQPQQDYLLVMGNYRRIDNTWRAEGEAQIAGEVQQLTVELGRSAIAKQAFRFFRDQIAVGTRRELYSCSGLLCGSSNTWANTHFRKAVLYGLDNDQYYGVYEISAAQDETSFAVIYTVKRGNGSVFAQLERIKVSAAEIGRFITPAKSVVSVIQEQGYFSVPLSFGADGHLQVAAAQLQALADAINGERGRKFVLVGHDYSGASAEQKIKLGLEHAESLLLQLKARGLRGDKVGIFSVGNRAPAGRGNSSVRVDLIRD